MSCFIVPERQVSAIVEELADTNANPKLLTAMGRTLLEANWRAYRHRYGADVDGLEGKQPWRRYRYTAPERYHGADQLARWASCLAYQLAEGDDHESTTAYKMIRPLVDQDQEGRDYLSWVMHAA